MTLPDIPRLYTALGGERFLPCWSTRRPRRPALQSL